MNKYLEEKIKNYNVFNARMSGMKIDDYFNLMSNFEKFESWCEDEGLICYAYKIRNAIEEIYGIVLND